MERPLHALQDKFLQDLRESKTLVAVFLVNGIRLQGQVEFFDNWAPRITYFFGHSCLVTY